MLFSIVIPMYNLENYIGDTLESILKNDLSDCELLLLDDGSTDKTVEMAELVLKEKNFGGYTIVRKKNTGVSDTRNQGIKIAKGKYIIFCDGDDFVEADMIRQVTDKLQQDVDMVLWPFYILQEMNKRPSQENTKDALYSAEQMMDLHLLEGYKVRLGSFAVKRDLLIEKQINFARECTFAEDMEFIMKCILNSRVLQWIASPFYCYVKREGSLMNSYNIRRFESSRAIERVYLYLLDNNISLHESLKEYIQNGLYILHYIYSLEGCMANIHTQKEGRKLYREIHCRYADVEKECKKKILQMNKAPIGMSAKRVSLLKMGTYVYIQVRLITKRIKGC